MSKHNRYFCFLVLAALFISLALTSCKPREDTETETPKREVILSAWLPYWDYRDAVRETKLTEGYISEAVVFAALFDGDNDSVYLPSGAKRAIEALKEYSGMSELFLSVTNDVNYDDGRELIKDTELLQRLFADSRAMEAHIDDLLSICSEYGVDGIEIDYEAIGSKDSELWSKYIDFIEALNRKCIDNGYKLRVALGSSAVRYAGENFPEGPEYVVMCYNLYGSHSGPGPKADASYLKKTFEENKALPGKTVMAFANGGYDWCGDSCRALTEDDISSLVKKHSATPQRDAESNAMYFSYSDESGISHEVWYSDSETLSAWSEQAIAAGYGSVCFWRFGGNEKGELYELFKNLAGDVNRVYFAD